ncbi:hypothetical protein ACTXHA_28595 [Burkholderia cenocepacia]
MGTGNQRDQLRHKLEMARRDLKVAQAAADPSKFPADRPPNEARLVAVERALAEVERCERELQEYDQGLHR